MISQYFSQLYNIPYSTEAGATWTLVKGTPVRTDGVSTSRNRPHGYSTNATQGNARPSIETDELAKDCCYRDPTSETRDAAGG